jgi:cardiolipin synthase
LSLLVPILHFLVFIRILLRPHRDPAARLAWLLVVGIVPIFGMVAYLLFGEVRTEQRRHRRHDPAAASQTWSQEIEGLLPDRYRNLFLLGKSINGFSPVAGNEAKLFPDSDAAIDALVTDIDAASRHVHICFYIWLTDRNGTKVVDALKRAAQRGVSCRVLADDVGSREMIRSQQWAAMRRAGARAYAAQPIGNPILQILRGRVDVRNHRKVAIIDGRTTYCGSQNCADPAFLPKAKYGPWVDVLVRFTGPIAAQNQALFAEDWASATGEDLDGVVDQVAHVPSGAMPAQVIGTGVTVRYSAMSELFEALFFTARRELIVTTPYYVPDVALQAALRASAYRGVDTILILPARNDSWVVAAASRSYYADLIEAGVRIHEYRDGLLHTKSITVDGEITLIGSANLDRRSFELNFENNIMVFDESFTGAIRNRQQEYLRSAPSVTAKAVAAWPISRRLFNNAVATLGPLL